MCLLGNLVFKVLMLLGGDQGAQPGNGPLTHS